MIQSIRGTKDILPNKIKLWQYAEDIFRTVSNSYGYYELRTPIFEKTEVFSRSIGEETDIVNKEMYTFQDRSGESLTLRPEGTAAIARAVIQNSLLQSSNTLKLWYSGPYFRYERPQKGRMRQFHQYGAECIGTSNPESDAEIILLANDLIKKTGVSDYKLLLNSLGSSFTREKYRFALVDFLSAKKDKLSEDSKKRLKSNPLRILDSKSPQDIEILRDAPTILDFLDEESKNHFELVKSLLENTDIEIEIQPQLVRGLDYYSHTVFEFQSSALGSQNSIGGGGRYDGLFKQLGYKKNVPAVGFAMGIERLLLTLEETNNSPDLNNSIDIYIVSTNAENLKILQNIAQQLRNKNFKVLYDLQRRSFKAQMREANKTSAKYTIIAGEDEIKKGKLIIKDMANSKQIEYPLNKIAEYNFPK